MANIVLWANNAGSTLASSITTSQTSITLTSGGGALFPSPAAGQFFALSLTQSGTAVPQEIVYCTARSGDALTVERAQEGTPGTAFNAGDLAQNLITAGTLGFGDFPTGVASLSANTTITGANAGTFYNVNGSYTITLNASTFTAGQTIGFLAVSACTITASSGTFYGGSLSGASIAMPAGSFVALQWGGVNWRQLAGSFVHGQLLNVQIFDTPGTFTYTPTPGMQSAIVKVQGGGSGSGGGAATTSPQVSLSGGGMSGALAVGRYTASIIGASQTITVGVGGAAGVPGNSLGGSGGDSAFGSIATAQGAGGSQGYGPTTGPFAAPGAGSGNTPPAPQATGGNIANVNGAIGALSIGGSTFGPAGAAFAVGGGGAPSPLFGGAGPGAGGDGAAIAGNEAAVPGNSGQAGAVLIYEYS